MGCAASRPQCRYNPLFRCRHGVKNPPEIITALKDYLDSAVLGYTHTKPEYYNALISWMKRRQSFEFTPEDVVICPGIVSALHYFAVAYAKPGEGVIVMNPVYPPFFDCAQNTGRKTVLCPLTEGENLSYSIDYEKLEALCSDDNNTLLIFCNPHNPVGRVWTRDELYSVAEICSKHGVVLVSDEIHSDIIMPGYTHYSMGRLNEFIDNIIVCTAPSKTFNLATMQTSNIIIKNPALRQKLLDYKKQYCVEVQNALGFVACTAGYTGCGDWLLQMIDTVYENYRYVKAYLKDNLPDIHCTELMGTYLLWIDFRKLSLDGVKLDELMRKHELYFTNGFGFKGEGFMRMNLACPTRYIISAMERLSEAVEEVNLS